jgi:hypothetical protein
MTNRLEEQLSAGMRESATGLTLSGDVLGRATRNHRRRVATVRLGYALGVAGLAGVLAAGLTLGGGGAAQPDAKAPPATQVQAPSLRLANAAAASDEISYRSKLTLGAPGAPDITTYEGAFDPRTDTGYLRCVRDHGVLTELLINGTRYFGTEPLPGKTPTGVHEAYSRYGEYPGKHEGFSYNLSNLPAVSGVTADPASLFKALKEANAEISQNPDGTLHFRIRQEHQDGVTVYDGDVTIGADGRIAKVAIAGTWESTAKGRLDKGAFTMTLELYDYGLDVRVERPADVVPAN